LEVLVADELCILERLVGGEVSDEPAIAERVSIAIEHKHAATVARECK
jgi:hypothetical protein